MVKRVREEEDVAQDQHAHKRTRLSSSDRFSALSDELLLKVLSFLPISQLVVTSRLSHKYRKLAADDQIWKEHYYDRFVRPRASRLPGLRDTVTGSNVLNFASKASRWLDEHHLVLSGGNTDWKRQYKLRHNWTRGHAAINEIPVAERAAIPPTLVAMDRGLVYTVDQTDGLRAWTAKGTREMVAQLPFQASRTPRPPTAITTDTNSDAEEGTKVLVGFEDGSYSLYSLQRTANTFLHIYSHTASSNGVISAVTLSWPYVVTMTATQLLSLYRFPEHPEKSKKEDVLDPPRLLHSLKSHTVWPPLSTSLRTSASAIIVSIAYTVPTYLSGWTVGIQELRVTPEGKFLNSRLASAIDSHYRPLAFSTRPTLHHLAPLGIGLGSSSASELRHIHSKPTSLSYTHPYLLVSHPDNTLTLYLVTSTRDTLAISNGSRLWGHTSSVSGAHVGNRGKAVSVSRRGDELRVWELEGGFSSTAARKRLAGGDLSVQVMPDENTKKTQSELSLIGKALSTRPCGTACGLDSISDEPSDLTLTRGWVGFDEENVVVLKEESQGRQALVVYDFT